MMRKAAKAPYSSRSTGRIKPMRTSKTHVGPAVAQTSPYVLQFADGRSVALQLPAGTIVRDRGGETAFTPAGIRFLDRVRALFTPMRPVVTPGFIKTLREALRMTQADFGSAVGVDKMTVFRWEKGTLRPGKSSLHAIEKLRVRMTRRGVLMDAVGSPATKNRRRPSSTPRSPRSYRTTPHTDAHPTSHPAR